MYEIYLLDVKILNKQDFSRNWFIIERLDFATLI